MEVLLFISTSIKLNQARKRFIEKLQKDQWGCDNIEK